MEFTQEFDVHKFEFWGPAKDNVSEIRKAGKLSELERLIEDVFGDRTPSMTEINDFVSYERDMIWEDLGLEDEEEHLG